MHLRSIEIFCEIVERRSFSKAAEAHKVSQSLASQTVHSLEKRLGTRLIDRSKRPLELTPAGQVYFDGCRGLLDSFRGIEDTVRRMADKVVGRVRIAAIYSVGLLEMEANVKQFEELYPDVELHLEYLHPREVYARVLNDEADIGLVSFPRDGGEISSIPWQWQEMVLVLPPKHRLAGMNSVPVAELNDEPYIALTPELTIRKQVDRWLRQARVTVEVVHEFDNIENIKRAVEIGAGVAVLPLPTVWREVESGSLGMTKLQDVQWHRPLGIVHKRHKTLSTAAGKFVKLLRESPSTVPGAHVGDLARNGRPSRNAAKQPA